MMEKRGGRGRVWDGSRSFFRVLRGGIFGVFFSYLFVSIKGQRAKNIICHQQKVVLHEHSENGVEIWENEKTIRRYCPKALIL